MRRYCLSSCLLLCLAGLSWSQEPKDPPAVKEPAKAKDRLLDRYGYEAELKSYPQKTPKDTLESIIKSIIDQRFEYVLAHLVDPAHVDAKVGTYMKAESLDRESDKVIASARLGCLLAAPEEGLVERLKLPRGLGLFIDDVKTDSAGANAGLRRGDVLLELDSVKVSNRPGEFLTALRAIKPTTPIQAVVIRAGKLETIKGLVLPDVAGPQRALGFRKLTQETINLFFLDAERIQELRMFAQGAEWKIDGDRAVGTHKQIGRTITLVNHEERWFLENRPARDK